MPYTTFSEDNFKHLCDELAARDEDLAGIIQSHGYPPLWKRPQGFETLVYIILEQQVSLASAKAAYDKLKERLNPITPQSFLLLSDEELKACYFSRQKIKYSRHLAEAIINNEIDMDHLQQFENDLVREHLIKLKGIGNWTIDIYLMMCLNRTDLFPLGDIALINSIKEVKHLPKDIDLTEIENIIAAWAPYQTIAAYLLWHAYLSKRKRQG